MKKKIRWTDEMIRTLQELYPVETNAYTASVLGIGEKTVIKKAKELGIDKFAKSRWMERADYIRANFDTKSFAEMGRKLGIAKWSVARIAAQIGLRRTDKETSDVSSRVRTELIQREKRRMIFGLDPITHIKVVTNRPRIKLRAWLKSKGYIVGEQRNVMYYPADIERRTVQESRGKKLGMSFIPLSVDDETIIATAI